MQFVLSPIATNAADVVRSAGVNSNSTLLKVDIKPGREVVAPGELIIFDLKVANTSATLIATAVRLIDVLPVGLKFKKGSVLLNGVAASDPTISADNRALNFAAGDLAPAAYSSIHFEARVIAGNQLGKVVNVASAFSSDAGKSNVAKSIITVTSLPVPIPKETPPAEPVKAEKPVEILIPTPPKKSVKAEKPVEVPVLTPSKEQVKVEKPVEILIPTPPKKTVKAEKPVEIPVPVPAKEPVKVEKQPESVIPNAFAVPISQDLVKLTGKSEIPVLADVDGKYIKKMDDTQMLEKEFASRVSEANLFESIRAGRSFSRESLAALARTEQAKAQTGQVFATMLPSVLLHVNSGMEISRPSVAVDGNGSPVSTDTHSRTDASLTVRQPLFDLPGYRDLRRRELIEKSRDESYRVSDGDAYLSAVNAYLALVSSRLQTDMTREFETQLNELLVYVEKRAKAGAASNSDMARVRARSQATLSSRLEQESAHAAAGIEFVRLTNLVPQKVRIPLLDDVGVSLLPHSFDTAVTEAMKSNPEIASLVAELQAAQMDKSAAKGRYMPRVDAEYTYNYSLHADGASSSAGQKDQRIMAVLNWALFSGGADYKTNVERTARHKELEYRLDDQRRRVIQTLSANYATLATTRERITSGYQELTSISTAAEAMSKRMLSGNQSLLDLLDVYDRFYQVRSRLVSLHVLEMSTVAQLVRLTRGAPVVASGAK
jgi:uncharacterized repeat protein (TIGR01451 family)